MVGGNKNSEEWRQDLFLILGRILLLFFWDEVGALKAYKNLLGGKVCDFSCHSECNS